MSAVSYVSGLWQRCVDAVRRAADGSATQSSEGLDVAGQSAEGATGDPALLVYAQALWMGVTLAVLFALSLLSLRLYFVVSFIGLLLNRLLFAPREQAGKWWRVVNAVTWVCFAVLTYVLYQQVAAALAASGSA